MEVNNHPKVNRNRFKIGSDNSKSNIQEKTESDSKNKGLSMSKRRSILEAFMIELTCILNVIILTLLLFTVFKFSTFKIS